MALNFDLAPPVKTVDGLTCVPIDIQHIQASFVFDGAAQSGTADATIEFTCGPQAGCPIFDLRQTPTAAWLDSAPIATSLLAHHDFGGGPGADLRVVAQTLPAGSTHTLRVTYALGLPQSPAGGSYPPALSWSAGPRLRLSFGFTDLVPARYLEAWIPANLVFDQYSISLEVRILNTTVAHTAITNGALTPLATNHFRIAWPDRAAAFSTLLELRAGDTVTSQSDTVVLAGSASPVTVEAWKLTSNTTVVLGTQINLLKGFLQANASQIGPYLHGNRFVAFLHSGGMEYDGGTTTGTGPLEHETHHSWWARGVLPASQADAFWDEGWTVYVTDGSAPLAFSGGEATAILCPQNPWQRHTQGNAYDDGERLFQGIGAITSDAAMRAAMSDFYKERNARPQTTLGLEAHLVARTGRAELVDVFHRWAYGLSGPPASSVPNLWLRDDSGHAGQEAWAGRFWDSPDLWVRRKDDGGTSHQNPVHGRDNWIHARVRNRAGAGTARHFLVTFEVKTFAGTQFVYPGDFLPALTAAGGFELGPGESRVVKALWPAAKVPATGTHGCLLASAHARSNHPADGRHVWEENALAQKNLTIVAARPGSWFTLSMVVGHFRFPREAILLEVRRPEGAPSLPVIALKHDAQSLRPAAPRELADCGHCEPESLVARPPRADLRFRKATEVPIPAGKVARLAVQSSVGFPLVLGMRVQVPADLARRKKPAIVDFVQLDAKGRPVGGVAVQFVLPGAD